MFHRSESRDTNESLETPQCHRAAILYAIVLVSQSCSGMSLGDELDDIYIPLDHPQKLVPIIYGHDGMSDVDYIAIVLGTSKRHVIHVREVVDDVPNVGWHPTWLRRIQIDSNNVRKWAFITN